MSKYQERYIVRFPKGMREEIKAHAAKNERSINSEIIFRIKAGYFHAGIGLDCDFEVPEGWTMHDGTRMPVPGETLVYILKYDGIAYDKEYYAEKFHDDGEPNQILSAAHWGSDWVWSQCYFQDDRIVAYKVVDLFREDSREAAE